MNPPEQKYVAYRIIRIEANTEEILKEQIDKSITGTRRFGKVSISAFTLPPHTDFKYLQEDIVKANLALDIIKAHNALDNLNKKCTTELEQDEA